MDTRTFLSRILPAEGNGGYVLTIIKPNPDPNKPAIGWNFDTYDTLDDIARGAASCDKKQAWSVYFAVGTHTNNLIDGKHKRRKDTAYRFKSLCVDLDVGTDKQYHTRREAGAALMRACETLTLPSPLIVASGNGLHVYWPLTDVISTATWEKASISLRMALESQGLQIDVTKIHDPSMVLRPVGTTHKKDPANPREVKVLQDAPDNDTAALFAILKPYYKPATPTRNAKGSTSSIINAVLDTEYSPIVLEHAIEGCAQLAALASDGGATAQEPLWFGSLGFAKHCTDVEAAVHTLASGHPDFDMVANLNKMQTWDRPPPTCTYFENLNPKGCAACPNKGHIKSPAALSRGVSMVASTDEVFTMPAGYVVKNDMVYREFRNTRKTKSSDGDTIEEEFDDIELVCPYVLVPKSRYTDVARSTSVAVIKAKYPIEGWRTFDLPLSMLMAGGADLQKLFGDQQLYIGAKDLFNKTRSFLLTYLHDLQRYAATSYKYETFGWQKDGTFLLGHTLIGAEGARDYKLDGAAETLAEHVCTKGTLQNWTAATAAFDHDDAALHGFFFLAGLAAPMMYGSTIASCFLHMYAPDSGSGKTTTLRAVISSYGDPDKLGMGSKDTDNAMYKMFGVLQNLTPCVDELTEVFKTDPGRTNDMMYQIANGQEKRTLTQKRDMREPCQWRAPVLGTSNVDIFSVLDARMSNEGTKARVLQGYFPRSDFFNKYGRKLNLIFSNNFGHATPILVAEIMKRGGAHKLYEEAYAKFNAKHSFHFDAQERYLEAVFVMADACGEICNDLGLIAFDHNKVIARGIQEMGRLRTMVDSSHNDALDMLSQFWLENNDAIVESSMDMAKPGSKPRVKLPAPDTAHVRMDISRDGQGKPLGGWIHTNRSVLRTWLQKRGGDYQALLRGLADLGLGCVDNQRISIMRGCEKSNPGQAYCMSLDMNHPRIWAALAHPDMPDVSTRPMLAIIQGGK